MPTLKAGRYIIPEKWNGATMGRWVLGKDTETGKDVFIKEFQGKRFRDNPENRPNIARANERTEAYRQRMERINAAVGRIARTGGDVVVTTDFFREENMLYKVTEKIDLMPWEPQEVHEHLDVQQVDNLMLRLVNAISALHAANLLHCDLKAENVFIVKRDDSYVGMISDFDDSFFMDEIPPCDDVVGTPEYMSPELALYKQSEASEPSEDMPLTTASDMFAIGLIYHMYLTGTMPAFDEEYGQFFAVLFDENGAYELSDKLDVAHRVLIQKLLFPMPSWRITTCSELASEIKNLRKFRDREFKLTIKEGGKPVASRKVPLYTEYRVNDADGVTTMYDLAQMAKTDSKGRVTLRGMSPDMPLFVQCGEDLKRIEWKKDGTAWSGEAELAATLVYSILVKCDGKPCPGVKVTLCRKTDSGMEALEPKQTGSDGRIAYEDLQDGVYIAKIGKMMSRITWDSDRSFTLGLKTYTLRLRSGDAPAVNKVVELYVNLGEEKRKMHVGKTDSHGVLRMRLFPSNKRWTAVCEGKQEEFAWPASGVHDMALAKGTKGIFLTTLHGVTTPVPGVTVAIVRYENGTEKPLRKKQTDINGLADMGMLPPGEYGVGLLETPKDYKPYRIRPNHFFHETIDGTKDSITWRLSFTRNIDVGDPGTILKDLRIPESVSKRWRRIIRYKDGSILLVGDSGETKKLRNENQLGLYGLSGYKEQK